MATIRKKTRAAADLGRFLIDKGGLMTLDEYKQQTRVPMRIATLKKFYGNWGKALRFIEKTQPEIWAELQKMDKLQKLSEVTVEETEADEDTE